MRVIGGADRGRKLRAPRGTRTRPTASKVRQALFNILGPPPKGLVLDLFAGTGALGIEAVSRGAEGATFVERDGRALSVLRENLRDVGIADRATVLPIPVHQALVKLATEGKRYVWVFIDPPYATTEGARALELLAASELLACGGVIVIEHDKRHVPPDEAGPLRLTDRRYYGDSGLSFYRRDPGLA